ncbi:MAG: ATP-binding protein [Actinomycetota bacterium]
MPRSYDACLNELWQRVAMSAPNRIQLLTGPRQVGKTTLLLSLAKRLEGRAVYAAADGPEASLPGFWERIWEQASAIAAARGYSILLIDEIHVLADWSTRLKGEWDRLRRRRITVGVVATGSSALRVGSGARESLAGRFERLTLAHWSAAALTSHFRMDRSAAAEHAVLLGTYPGAMELREDRRRFLAYLRDAIVEPAIGRDVMALATVRRPALLRQVFGMCAVSPAQIVSLQKMQSLLPAQSALETIAHYLSLLEEAFLVSGVQKYAARAIRRRASPPKIVVLNNGLLAAMDPDGVPDRGRDPQRFGRWVENACIAHAWNAGQQVWYWREEPHEVDAVIEGDWGRRAIEIKTGPLKNADLTGLLEFCRRFPRFRPLVVCDADRTGIAERVGVPAIGWPDFLHDGPPPE